MDTILSYVSGPAFIFVLRYLAPVFVKKLPAATQPVVAALVSVGVALLTGDDPSTSAVAAVEALQVLLGTWGVVKAIDIGTGQSNTVTAEEKEKVRELNY